MAVTTFTDVTLKYPSYPYAAHPSLELYFSGFTYYIGFIFRKLTDIFKFVNLFSVSESLSRLKSKTY